MTAFVPLRALGWTQAKPAPAPVIAPIDPAQAELTAELHKAGLFRRDASLSVVHGAGRITVRAFLREMSPEGDRAHRSSEAQLVRAVIASTLSTLGFSVRFTDAMFCERGQRGWAVLAAANPRPCRAALS